VCFRVALKALSKNKLQTGLTMLGLIIGVATVLTMFALGSGAQTAIESQVKAAGMNIITVASGNHMGTVEDDTQNQPGGEDGQESESMAMGSAPPQTVSTPVPEAAPAVTVAPPARPAERFGDPEADIGVPATLALSDAADIRKIPGVQYVSEGLHTNARLGVNGNKILANLHGDDTSLQFIRRAWKFDVGRFYSQEDQNKGAQVMVLGNVLAERMFGKEKPIGKVVMLWNQPFQVIGVIGSGSWMVQASKGDDQFDAAYVPFTTLHRLLGIDKISDITLTVAAAGDVTRTIKTVTATLRQSHHIQSDLREDFTVTSQARKAIGGGGMRREMAKAITGNMDILDKVTLEQMSKTLNRASKTMTALLASVAAVSLLVGGIGIMNTMLLSVTERTKEIGLRRALGARSKDVLRQFLMESTVMSVTGGLVGVLLGLTSSIFITRWAGWSTSISPIAIAIAFGAAAAVGVFFGYYPARQASSVAPMESLRYE
jgi:ABC-type antimicrobial peptide transport system permease subunit